MSCKNPVDKSEETYNLYIRQKEYFQFLFEQEKHRAASIVAGAKIYIASLIFILGTIFLKVIPFDKLVTLFSNNSISYWKTILVISISIISAVSIIAALIFSILVMKVWSYERLCNPIERFKETLYMQNEIEVISKSISDFAVATSINNMINNKRAKYLSYALGLLIFGTIFTLITATLLNLIFGERSL